MIAGRGFASLTLPGRRRSLAYDKKIARQTRRTFRKGQECTDACSTRGGGGIWGDVNGDCQFTSADVLSLQDMVNSRSAFNSGVGEIDPLASWCHWRQQQANPSLDHNDDGSPRIDLEDAQYMLFVIARKYRFLTEASAECSHVPNSVDSEEFIIRARV
eukprot:1917714-Pleurochrysis_carterae.AAC.1